MSKVFWSGANFWMRQYFLSLTLSETISEVVVPIRGYCKGYYKTLNPKPRIPTVTKKGYHRGLLQDDS